MNLASMHTMRSFLLVGFLLLFASARLLAITPVPYLESVSFSCSLTAPNDSGGGTTTVYDELGAPWIGSGANGGESTTVTGWIRPSKQYRVTYTAGIIGHYNGTNYDFSGSYSLSFTVPDGYVLIINGGQADLCGNSFNTSQSSNQLNINDTYTVELRAVANPAPAMAGGFSGIDLGKSVSWDVGLGGLRSGQSAGRIVFKEVDFTNSPGTRDRLYYSAPANNGQITTVKDGSSGQRLQQVGTPQTVVNIWDDTDGTYWFKFYTPSQATYSGGSYTFTGSPWRTIHVTFTSATNQLTITQTEGSVSQTSSLTLTSGSISSGTFVWTLKEGVGSTWLRTTTHTSTNNGGTPSTRDDVVVVRTGDTGGTMVAKTKFHYVTQAWGEEVAEIVADPDSAALKTDYTYWGTSTNVGNYRKVQSVSYPTGNWSCFIYWDDWSRRGQLKAESHPFASTPGSTAETTPTSAGYEITYDYGPDYSGRSANLTSRINYATAHQTGQQSTTPTLAQHRGSLTYSSFAALDYSTSTIYQTTTTEVIDPSATSPDYSSLPYSVKRPDQSQDSYAYFYGNYDGTTFAVPYVAANGPMYFRTNVWHGSTSTTGADSFTSYGPSGYAQTVTTINLVPNVSTMEVTIRDPGGLVLRKETQVYTGSGAFALLTYETLAYDNAGRLTSDVASNGATSGNTYVFTGTQEVIKSTDRTGTETDCTYDVLGRVATAKKIGVAAASPYLAQADITVTNTYDGANHVTQQVTSSGSLSLTTTNQFDFAGRQTQHVDPGDSTGTNAPTSFTTVYGYTSGGRIVTTTMPGGATKIVETYYDGQLKQVSGTGVIAQNASYSVDATTGQTIQQSWSGGVTATTVTVNSDWLGRTIQRQQPGGDGTTATQNWYYNTAGQLYKCTKPGMSAMLYNYDTLGRLTSSGLDINGNSGQLDPLSDDRFTTQNVDFYTADGGTSWWLRTRSYVYATSGNSASTLAGTRYDKLKGFGTNIQSETDLYDIHNNYTIISTTVDSANKKVYNTTAASDSTVTALQVIFNGLAVEAKDKDGYDLTCQFDALGRPVKSIDPRTGSAGTVTAYASGCSLVKTVTDPAGTTQATYTYGSTGRVSTVTNAVSKVARYEYDLLGHKVHEWGSATYPVEYVYDSASGRQTKLHTFRGNPTGSATWADASWPTSNLPSFDETVWAYQAATGLLQSKTDPSTTNSVNYTYFQAGQVHTRTWARGVVTTYGYSATTAELTGVTYSSDPYNTAPLTYTYNRLGQLATAIDQIGTHTLNYNLSGSLELSSETLPSFYGTRQVAYTYDTSGSGTLGRPTGYSVGVISGTTEQNVAYTYDSKARLHTLGSSSGTSSQTFTYNYDTTSNPHLIDSVTDSAAIYSDGRTYNATNDWVASRTAKNTSTNSINASFAYTPDTMGRVQSVSKTGAVFAAYYDGNGVKTAFTYSDSTGVYDRSEVNSEVTKNITDSATIQPRNDTYAYDPIGNRTTVVHNGNSATYTPNNLNQYSQRTVPGFFDVAGSAASGATVTVNGSSSGVVRDTQYFFDKFAMSNSPNDAYTSTLSVSDGTNTTTLSAFVAGTPESMSYDADGNITQDGNWNYYYDAENRLLSVQTSTAAQTAGVPKTAWDYYYDYLGRRVWKLNYLWSGGTWVAQTGQEQRYVYNGWNLVAKYNGSMAFKQAYVWGIDVSGPGQGAGGVGGLLMIQDSGNSYLPIYDAMGNVYGLLDTTGGLVATYEYDAFGKTLRESGSYADSNPWRYSTRFTDIETGLIYYGKRLYNPSTGRFINRDPIEEAGGLNLYGFCGNNGVNGYDYLGMANYLPIGDGVDMATLSRQGQLYANSECNKTMSRMYGVCDNSIGANMSFDEVPGASDVLYLHQDSQEFNAVADMCGIPTDYHQSSQSPTGGYYETADGGNFSLEEGMTASLANHILANAGLKVTPDQVGDTIYGFNVTGRGGKSLAETEWNPRTGGWTNMAPNSVNGITFDDVLATSPLLAATGNAASRGAKINNVAGLSSDDAVDQLARIIYRETSSLRPIAGTSTYDDLDAARLLMAQALLNRLANNLPVGVSPATASNGPIGGSELTAILTNNYPPAIRAWNSSVDAVNNAYNNYLWTNNINYFNNRPGADINTSYNSGVGKVPSQWSPAFNNGTSGPVRIYFYPGP